MPDWQSILRRRLGPLRLSPQGEADVLAELAAHFEDDYSAQRDAGLPAGQAVTSTLAQVRDWKRFRRDLQNHKEGPMNHRARVFWLPGFFSCLFCFLLLKGMVLAGLEPKFVWLAPSLGIAFYIPWFAALIAVGAAVAWWSRRAGGSARERLEAVLLPSMVMTLLFTVLLFIALIFERHMPVPKMLLSWLLTLLAWAGGPAVGLLLGALPFLGSGRAHDHAAAAQS